MPESELLLTDEIDNIAEVCTWSKDPEEHRRAFIFFHLANAEIDGRILVENMDLICRWIKDGTVPTSLKKKP